MVEKEIMPDMIKLPAPASSHRKKNNKVLAMQSMAEQFHRTLIFRHAGQVIVRSDL